MWILSEDALNVVRKLYQENKAALTHGRQFEEEMMNKRHLQILLQSKV